MAVTILARSCGDDRYKVPYTAGPTDTDKPWAALYVDLGADRTNVATLLDQPG